MTRPPFAKTLTLSAALVLVSLSVVAAEAGGPRWLPGQPGAGHVVAGPGAAVPPPPVFGPRSYSARVLPGPQTPGLRYNGGPQIFDLNASREDNYARAYRALVTGDFRYGRYYDALLTRAYGGAGAAYLQPGPTIIPVSAPAAAAGPDPLVIPAPSQAGGYQHGVRVVYLSDPPAEFQLQAGAPPLPPRRGKAITPKY